MPRGLTQRQKISIAVGILIAILLAAFAIYYWTRVEENSTDKAEDQGAGAPLNVHESGGLEQNSSSDNPRRNSFSPKTPVKKVEGQSFFEAMRKLQDNPRDFEALAEAELSFPEARSNTKKESPHYHPALESKDFQTYLETSSNSDLPQKEKYIEILESKKQMDIKSKVVEPTKDYQQGVRMNQSPKTEPQIKETTESLTTEKAKISKENLMNNPITFDDISGLSKSEVEKLIEETKDFQKSNESKNVGVVKLLQGEVNIGFLKLAINTVLAYPEDDALKSWAKTGFTIRDTPAFREVFKNHAKYKNLYDVLMDINGHGFWLEALHKNAMAHVLGSEYRKFDLAIPQIICDNNISAILLNSLKYLDKKPELVDLLMDFSNPQDENKLKETVDKLLTYEEINIRPWLESMKGISPYRQVLELIAKK